MVSTCPAALQCTLAGTTIANRSAWFIDHVHVEHTPYGKGLTLEKERGFVVLTGDGSVHGILRESDHVFGGRVQVVSDLHSG